MREAILYTMLALLGISLIALIVVGVMWQRQYNRWSKAVDAWLKATSPWTHSDERFTRN